MNGVADDVAVEGNLVEWVGWSVDNKTGKTFCDSTDLLRSAICNLPSGAVKPVPKWRGVALNTSLGWITGHTHSWHPRRFEKIIQGSVHIKTSTNGQLDSIIWLPEIFSLQINYYLNELDIC